MVGAPSQVLLGSLTVVDDGSGTSDGRPRVFDRRLVWLVVFLPHTKNLSGCPPGAQHCYLIGDATPLVIDAVDAKTSDVLGSWSPWSY